ncbi:uncharacterized protein [Triticum aestivum]|uniref:uncharacterized protein isoform X1 n=1 Tax=Triticum aestivum TaxID=4565 RepID=UPI001D00400B|nr:uncharacterized protein LOC123134633 isoform X1 [Triticum aestivum]
MAHLPRAPPRTSWFHEFPPSPHPVPSSGPPLRRGFPDARPRRSRRHAAGAASPIGGGSGGARDTLQRAPPLQALDAHQRVQGNGLDVLLMMATASSCGGINTRRTDNLLPLLLPCVREQTSAPRVSSASSRARSDSAAADAEENEPEASAGRSAQVLLAAAASGGRGGPYGRRPSSSCAPWNAGPLIAHRPATPSPVCCPVVASPEEQEQGSLPTRPADAVNEWRLPKVSEEEDEAVNQKDCQDNTMSCSVSSARDWNFGSDSVYEGSNHDGRAFDHSEVEDCAAAVQRTERRVLGPVIKQKESIVLDKLPAWKDSQILKLIYKALMILLQSTRLNQKDRWQKNKIARPGIRDELTETEEQDQGRLPTREDLVKCFSMPRNIRLQTPRHPSLLDMRVDKSNRGPPKFVHKATPARLMRRACSSHNYHGKCMGAIDAVNEWRLPKVNEEEDEAVDQKDWQDDTVSCRASSARDWNFESNSANEGSNHDDGHAFDHSDVEDCAAAVQRMERRLPGINWQKLRTSWRSREVKP